MADKLNTGKRLFVTLAQADASISRVLLEAARNAERDLADMQVQGTPFSTRASQAQILQVYTELRDTSHELWANKVPDEIAKMTALAEKRASENADLLDSLMMAQSNDPEVQKALRASQRQRAKRVVQVFKTREREAKFALSPRVYKWEALHNDLVERTIQRGMLRGLSQRDIARSVRHLIDPNTPGGVSYAAKRLGRTEVANAYHQQTINDYKGNPFVRGLKWNLSGSHPKPDVCDTLAKGHSARMASGLYLANEAPGKPHPQCLCVLTPETVSTGKFVKDYQSGKYNDYLLSKYPDLDPTGLP